MTTQASTTVSRFFRKNWAVLLTLGFALTSCAFAMTGYAKLCTNFACLTIVGTTLMGFKGASDASRPI